MNSRLTALKCLVALFALVLIPVAPGYVSAAVLSPAQLDRIVQQESTSSGFSQAQIRAAIQTTIEHGFSDSDAVKIVAVCEEVAFVRRVPLSYVVTQLLASINGDGASIIALDKNTAPLFRGHRHLSDVLNKLHVDFGKTFTRERCAQIGGC